MAMCTRALETSAIVADGSRELAFERAAVVDVLEKLGGAERGAVEDLEADAARRRQAPRRELEPELVDPSPRPRGSSGRPAST